MEAWGSGTDMPTGVGASLPTRANAPGAAPAGVSAGACRDPGCLEERSATAAAREAGATRAPGVTEAAAVVGPAAGARAAEAPGSTPQRLPSGPPATGGPGPNAAPVRMETAGPPPALAQQARERHAAPAPPVAAPLATPTTSASPERPGPPKWQLGVPERPDAPAGSVAPLTTAGASPAATPKARWPQVPLGPLGPQGRALGALPSPGTHTVPATQPGGSTQGPGSLLPLVPSGTPGPQACAAPLSPVPSHVGPRASGRVQREGERPRAGGRDGEEDAMDVEGVEAAVL